MPWLVVLLVFGAVAAYAAVAAAVCVAVERIGIDTEDAQSIAVLWPVAVLLTGMLWPLGIAAWMMMQRGAR